MIKLEQLDGLKLITDESVFRTEEQALDRVELAIQQGAGGWGVRPDDGCILRLARDLKIALTVAGTVDKVREASDEEHRKLKGAQMENGRLKKQRDNTQSGLDAALAQLAQEQARVTKLEAEVTAMGEVIVELQRKDLTDADS